ncbi:MAG: hypothetical protein RMA76_01595 [Deltaproteobacteria bacterium]|jgi:predicted metal-binding protein
MKAKTPPAKHATVFVCHECDGKKPRPKTVRAFLKAGVKAGGAKRSLRVVESECLDLCPKRAVAVCIARTASGATFHELEDDDAMKTLLSSLLEEVRRPG